MSPNVESKYKHHIRESLTKILHAINILTKENVAIMDQVIEGLTMNVKEGMKQEMDMNIQIGAVLICEDMAKVMRGDRFVVVFESIVQSMHALVESKIDTFKSTVQVLVQNG